MLLLLLDMVFPTGVGVFPVIPYAFLATISLPHRRGGVSKEWLEQTKKDWSSPQAWGCFQYDNAKSIIDLVFPTGVGVFLVKLPILIRVTRLPHRRGGVSNGSIVGAGGRGSSPQAWGCFLL